MRVMTGKWRSSTPHLVEVYEHVRAFVSMRYRLKVSYQWVPQSENKDPDAACTAARNRKGSVMFFEQPEVSPPCGHVCAVCGVSGDNMRIRAPQVTKALLVRWAKVSCQTTRTTWWTYL